MKKILKYETKQLLRDKKTIFFVFILPIVIFPVINGLFSKAVNKRVETIMEEKIELAVEKDSMLTELFSDSTFSDTLYSITYIKDIENKDSLLEKYPIVLSAGKDENGSGLINIFYSGKNDRGSIKARHIFRQLILKRRDIREHRYSEIGISEQYERSRPEIRNTATPEQQKNSDNSTFLPVSVLIILLIGTFMISNYVILGEKDNNTLESLLTSGVKRKDIIYGKMSMVILAGIIMSVLELLSFLIYGKFTGLIDISLSIGSSQMVIFLILIISSSFLISSVSVFLSCRMKSSTQGQLLFMPMMIIVLVLSLLGTFEGIEIRKGLLLLPVVNSAGMIKSVITGSFSIPGAFIVISVNLIYSFVMIRFSSDYLNSEDILGKDGDTDAPGKGFAPGAVYIMFGLLVVTYMLIGGYFQSKEIVSGLVLSQVLILGGFCVIGLRISSYSAKELFNFKKFSFEYLLIAVVLGIFSRYPIALLSEQLLKIFPVPQIFNDTDILSTGLGDLGIYELILIIAVLPAVFEELVFRGVFTSFLHRKYSGIKTAVITGIMFGAMHLNIFSFFETSVLGIIIGLITLASGSIFPAVIIHFFNNAFSAGVMKMVTEGQLSQQHWLLNSPKVAYTAGVTVLIIIVFLVRELIKKDRKASG